MKVKFKIKEVNLEGNTKYQVLFKRRFSFFWKTAMNGKYYDTRRAAQGYINLKPKI